MNLYRVRYRLFVRGADSQVNGERYLKAHSPMEAKLIVDKELEYFNPILHEVTEVTELGPQEETGPEE